MIFDLEDLLHFSFDIQNVKKMINNAIQKKRVVNTQVDIVIRIMKKCEMGNEMVQKCIGNSMTHLDTIRIMHYKVVCARFQCIYFKIKVRQHVYVQEKFRS